MAERGNIETDKDIEENVTNEGANKEQESDDATEAGIGEMDEKLEAKDDVEDVNIEMDKTSESNDNQFERGTKSTDKKISVVIIGRTGSGKSSVGNSLLGKNYFDTKMSPKSLTTKTSDCTIDDKTIVVIDTPGFFHTHLSAGNVNKEILKCFDIVKSSPLVFLYAMKVGRHSEEDIKSINEFEQLFGSFAFPYTVVVFTAKDYLLNENIQQYIQSLPKIITDFIDKCGSPVVAINNSALDSGHQNDRSDLITKIEGILQSKTVFYSKSWLPNQNVGFRFPSW